MSDPAPGWYPDPEENGGWRWWDGQQWGARVLLRADVRSTHQAHVRAKELLVTSEWITVDGDGLALDDINGVAFWRRWMLAQTFEYRQAQFELAGGGRQLGFLLSGRKDGTDAVARVDEMFLQLAQMLDAQVLTRIARGMADRLVAGEEIDMKGVTVTAEGVQGRGAGIKKKALPWGEITYAAWGSEWVRLGGPENPDGKIPLLQVNAKQSNAVALPALVDIMQGR